MKKRRKKLQLFLNLQTVYVFIIISVLSRKDMPTCLQMACQCPQLKSNFQNTWFGFKQRPGNKELLRVDHVYKWSLNNWPM